MNNKNNISKNQIDLPAAFVASPAEARGRISFRQVIIAFFVASISALTRILPSFSAEIAGKAGWLTPVTALIPTIGLIFVLSAIVKKHREKSYSEIIEMVFGKIAGKIFLSLFLLFTMFLVADFTRYFAEKMISSVFFDTDSSFFIILLLGVSYFAVRRNIQSFARFCEFIGVITAVSFVVFIFLGLFKIKPENLYPVTAYDIVPLMKSAIPAMGILSLFSFSLFLNDNCSNMKSFTNTSLKYSSIAVVFLVFIIVDVIGIFGAKLAENMYLPFFSILKFINILGITQSIETFYIILWVFIDFILVTYFLFVCKNIAKTLFVLENPKSIMTPILFIIYIMCMFIASNRFELDLFNRFAVNTASIATGFIFPLLLLLVGKIRKLL